MSEIKFHVQATVSIHGLLHNPTYSDGTIPLTNEKASVLNFQVHFSANRRQALFSRNPQIIGQNQFKADRLVHPYHPIPTILEMKVRASTATTLQELKEAIAVSRQEVIGTFCIKTKIEKDMAG